MSDLKATSAMLLSLLSEGPQTGGQLMASAARFGSFFTITRSQVYRELPSLVSIGLLRLGRQGPRSSQEYAITAAGRKRFKAWLSETPGPDHLRSPLMLRVMHAGALSATQRRALVTSATVVYSAEHDAAKALVSTAEDPYARAVAEFMAARTKAALKLLDSIPA